MSNQATSTLAPASDAPTKLPPLAMSASGDTADTSASGLRESPLLQAIRNNPQLPGLGTNVARLVSIADSEDESIHELRDVILADVHLTQRILAIANSVTYRMNADSKVSTISKAIVVVGFEQIKLIALGMLFVDDIPHPERAATLKAELTYALQSSLLARELSRRLAPDDRERAGIATLLANVARLLLVMVDLKSFQQFSLLVHHGMAEAAAAKQILGISMATLTEQILTSWGVPGAIVTLSSGVYVSNEVKPMQHLSRTIRLAQMTTQVLRRADDPQREVLLADVRRQCLADGGITGAAFDRWVISADAQLDSVRALFIATAEPPKPEATDGTVLISASPTVAGPRNASGRPANSRELVVSRLSEVTDLIAQGKDLTATLRAALECLHTGFGYSRSILLLRDSRTSSRFRTRLWRGDLTIEAANRLEIDINAPKDLFADAVRRGADLQVQNVQDPKIAARLPMYFTRACPRMASFILLPLQSGQVPIACLLLGRDMADAEAISSEDVSLLRAVRSQIVLALQTVR